MGRLGAARPGRQLSFRFISSVVAKIIMQTMTVMAWLLLNVRRGMIAGSAIAEPVAFARGRQKAANSCHSRRLARTNWRT